MLSSEAHPLGNHGIITPLPNEYWLIDWWFSLAVWSAASCRISSSDAQVVAIMYAYYHQSPFIIMAAPSYLVLVDCCTARRSFSISRVVRTKAEQLIAGHVHNGTAGCIKMSMQRLRSVASNNCNGLANERMIRSMAVIGLYYRR